MTAPWPLLSLPELEEACTACLEQGRHRQGHRLDHDGNRWCADCWNEERP